MLSVRDVLCKGAVQRFLPRTSKIGAKTRIDLPSNYCLSICNMMRLLANLHDLAGLSTRQLAAACGTEMTMGPSY